MLANILRYLAHCRLVLGVEEENRVSEVKELTVEALNYFSLAVYGLNYHELRYMFVCESQKQSVAVFVNC